MTDTGYVKFDADPEIAKIMRTIGHDAFRQAVGVEPETAEDHAFGLISAATTALHDCLELLEGVELREGDRLSGHRANGVRHPRGRATRMTDTALTTRPAEPSTDLARHLVSLNA